jgi:hypothetical protein
MKIHLAVLDFLCGGQMDRHCEAVPKNIFIYIHFMFCRQWQGILKTVTKKHGDKFETK